MIKQVDAKILSSKMDSICFFFRCGKILLAVGERLGNIKNYSFFAVIIALGKNSRDAKIRSISL